MSDLYVDLAIPGTVDKIFTYSVPHELVPALKRGVRVVTSFGQRTVVGFVVDTSALSQECAERGRNIPHIKPIQDILDREPVISDDLLHLTKWISEYYVSSWGEALKMILVQGAVRPGKRLVKNKVSDLSRALQELTHAPKQAAVLRIILQHGEISIQQLQKEMHVRSIHTTINDLVARGMIEIQEDFSRSRLAPKLELVIHITHDAKLLWQEWLTRPEASLKRVAKQATILRQLLTTLESSIGVSEVLKKSGGSLSALRTLIKKNLLTVSTREVVRTPEFEFPDLLSGAQHITLNAYQDAASQEICRSIDENRFHAFLLHGVTGSGKTQVYIETIREVLHQKKTAIVLVPEISLTPQTVQRFKQHFGNLVAVLHSRLSIGERYDAWRMAWEGRCSIVIGPRSAIFAPVKNLGLIVVDEEHEPSYKQFDQTPRYHARDVAVMRAHLSNAVVVLGSATPSLESYANAMTGKFKLLEMPERVDNAQLPEITVIDMTEERKKKRQEFRDAQREERSARLPGEQYEKRAMELSSLSGLLREKIEDRLKKKEGIILLQNRRGFSSFIECPDCGHVDLCDNCNISLTYHLTTKQLRCHYCGTVKQLPETCPACRSSNMYHHGFGTQRIEEELKKLFPHATTMRMDLDTTTRRGSHHEILRKFAEGIIDILLGTQMVAKGLDFSRVTLVGVVSADTQMLLPDFRSAERTFQLLTQVAGRAGRSTLAGEVIIQTYQPNHPSLKHVILHDYPGFYSEEVEYRRELDYPPISRLILVEFRGKQEQDVIAHAAKFADVLPKAPGTFKILGPAAAALTRLKGEFRWHIIMKSLKEKDPGGNSVHQALQTAVHAYKASAMGKSRLVRTIVDVDPVGMM